MLALSSPVSYADAMRRRLVTGYLAVAAVALCAGPSGDSTSAAGGYGGGDAGADCPTGPIALLNLTIKAASGPLPANLTLDVSWSAGPEPQFALSDATTWGTAGGGANVICDVTAPAPADLPALVCHLWTSGATHVEIHAAGYEPYASTLKPHQSAACKGPVPTDVPITLAPVPDAGAGGSP
jgi:hypothetical protein